jgi:2-polyprenyl-3-methyl-5-hydroxy-6-metoxy-1,4-benzoquinol methylase
MEAKDYYKNDGYFKKSPNLSLRKELTSRYMLIKQAKKRIKLMERVAPEITYKDKRILDVGCGYGELLYVFKKQFNSSVQGLEPSKETASLGTKMFNIPIDDLLLEEFISDEKFDIILCNHTLEHVRDPAEFLSELSALLKPDGYLYIEVPNIMSPTGGFSLNKFLYNEHLQTFSSYNLNELLKRVGLHTIEYSDDNFLRFFISSKDLPKKSTPVKISSNGILDFLENYSNDYFWLNTLLVYVEKLKYLLELTYYKISKDRKSEAN